MDNIIETLTSKFDKLSAKVEQDGIDGNLRLAKYEKSLCDICDLEHIDNTRYDAITTVGDKTIYIELKKCQAGQWVDLRKYAIYSKEKLLNSITAFVYYEKKSKPKGRKEIFKDKVTHVAFLDEETLIEHTLKNYRKMDRQQKLDDSAKFIENILPQILNNENSDDEKKKIIENFFITLRTPEEEIIERCKWTPNTLARPPGSKVGQRCRSAQPKVSVSKKEILELGIVKEYP